MSKLNSNIYWMWPHVTKKKKKKAGKKEEKGKEGGSFTAYYWQERTNTGLVSAEKVDIK